MVALYILVSLFVFRQAHSIHVEHVHVNTDHVVQTISDLFVGVTIDSIQLHGKSALHLKEPNLVKYAKELSPGYVRVGGTAGDHTLFGSHTDAKYAITSAVWDELNSFCHKTGLELIYGLNELDRIAGKWDTTNARMLLKYSASKGYKIAGFELGNEPNLFYRHSTENVSFSQLGADFQTMKHLLQLTPYSKSLILGPDTSGFKDESMREFLSHGGDVVDVITYHQYYFNGKTGTIADFYSAKRLDSKTSQIENAVRLAASMSPPKVAWMGETSSASGGGAQDLSDRYVAGFLWLDKLGLAARHGLKGVMRQALFGGRYGLLQRESHMDPNPDFWLTILYKRLVGNKVFEVNTSSRNIRIYAHCTRQHSQFNYKAGSLTVYALNLNTDPVKLIFSSNNRHMDVYWLTPNHGDLQTREVQLNGKTLAYSGDKFPAFTPHKVTDGQFTVSGRTFGYIVLPDANVAACKTSSSGTIIG